MSEALFDNTTMLALSAKASAYQNSPEERAAAVRAVCGRAPDAAAAAEVLEALGLDPHEGKAQASP